MNYIIFKGICSKDIEGLLISELPTITKPKMRTLITKIDGRDGDIIDELGYESYTKTLSIGLTRNFDIDKIINYFNGSGNLILSNESDKYYKATILEQIDYERLLRFKKAKVKFHVQPFKYKVNEPPFVFDVTNCNEIKVANQGLEISKPIITLYGSGLISIKINNNYIFQIDIDDEFVIIDSLEENAYKNSELKNRLMNGDFPTLKSGINIITWSGNLSKIKIDAQSRWL